ncbi:Ectonucleoside triphosphate diphosphohydrolase 6 [Saguinus oedipus]|uniref:Ectonucleoside triphosphate diphosphohydrolase 6 n=1 Tax=Saguinus oedipus TaxID=9490 RepID=A0ABQ9VLG7_SAGOE|nr:Ectonucleoside triphosphate diphosphohydrolase 6 [Saguinus oedipus]
MRKIPNHGSLRGPKVVYPLGLCVGLFIYVAYIKWHRAPATQAFSITGVAPGARWSQQARSPPGTAARGHEVFYGIMFDAGSTGTRVHIFQFAQPPRETPTLTHETFRALKPGLSAYADDVEKSAQGIQELLDVAKQDIPFDFWKATPLVLKATAGLRLLPGEKAQKLLQKVSLATPSAISQPPGATDDTNTCSFPSATQSGRTHASEEKFAASPLGEGIIWQADDTLFLELGPSQKRMCAEPRCCS